MLKLTPLDETVAGKELIQIGKSQGLQEGREEGIIFGQIHMTQNLLKQEMTPQEEKCQKKMLTSVSQYEKVFSLIIRRHS